MIHKFKHNKYRLGGIICLKRKVLLQCCQLKRILFILYIIFHYYFLLFTYFSITLSLNYNIIILKLTALGFTLIELIGVLVIIAIIALIVTPLVMNIIRRTKENARRRSVDNYGKSVENAIMSNLLDTGAFITQEQLQSLNVEYTGDTVICNVMQIKENGGLYLSECTVNGKDVKDSSTEDGWYHYNKRDLTNIEYVNMYGDALKSASVAYYNSHDKTPVEDYTTLDVDYNEKKEVICNTVRVNPDGTVHMTDCTVNGVLVEDTEEEDGKYHYGDIVYSMVEKLKYKKNNLTSVYNAEGNNIHEMYEFNHEATVQTPALTDYRYIGSDPYNYVTFNGNETWRIIGVFSVDDGNGNYEERVKLTRNDSLGNKQWNSSNHNEWVGSAMQVYLNDTYTLDDDSKEMIEPTKWYLGGRGNNSANGETFYTNERGTTVYSGRSTSWTGNVALMYPSDYIFTYALGVDDTCYNTPGSCNNSTPSNGWLYRPGHYQWTLASDSSDTSYVFYVRSSGIVNNYYASMSYGSSPVVYLKSNIRIKEGDGTSISPYKLEL